MSFCAQGDSFGDLIAAMKKVDEKLARRSRLLVDAQSKARDEKTDNLLCPENVSRDVKALEATNHVLKELIANEHSIKLRMYKSQETNATAGSSSELIVTAGRDLQTSNSFLDIVSCDPSLIKFPTDQLAVTISTTALNTFKDCIETSEKVTQQGVSKLATFKRVVVENQLNLR